MDKKLTELFNQFAGREVRVVDEFIDTEDYLGRKDVLHTLAIADFDPTIKAMREAAAKNGLNLRVNFPEGAPGGSICTYSSNPGPNGYYCSNDRHVSADLKKAPDGKYRIGDKFTIG